MQDQLLSHFIIYHTNPFCQSVIFPVLAGLMELENTSVTAHRPAVPHVSIPHPFLLLLNTFFLLSVLFFLAALNPQPSVHVHCVLWAVPALGLVPIPHPSTPSQIVVKGMSWSHKSTNVQRMRWLRHHCRNTAGPSRKQGCRGTTTTWNISLGLISGLHAAVSAHRQ